MDLNSMTSASELKSIEKECDLQIRLDNPYIVKLYDCFVEKNKLYMVMEWVKNGNLYSYLFKRRKFDEKEAFKYFF